MGFDGDPLPYAKLVHGFAQRQDGPGVLVPRDELAVGRLAVPRFVEEALAVVCTRSNHEQVRRLVTA